MKKIFTAQFLISAVAFAAIGYATKWLIDKYRTPAPLDRTLIMSPAAPREEAPKA